MRSTWPCSWKASRPTYRCQLPTDAAGASGGGSHRGNATTMSVVTATGLQVPPSGQVQRTSQVVYAPWDTPATRGPLVRIDRHTSTSFTPVTG